jgi:anthranilate phosphoribosyltransferase
VLSGERSPARDIVVLNAAAGLMAFDAEIAPRDAAARAAEAIDSGAAAGVLERLAALSHAS